MDEITKKESARTPTRKPRSTLTELPFHDRFGDLWQPLASLREEMDRVFETFWRGGGLGLGRHGRETVFGPALRLSGPAIDLVETEKDYRISAELPGMKLEEIELSVLDDVLTIKGEKKEAHEEKGAHYRVSERRFGIFRRSFELPRGVDAAHIEARFEKGVLHVVLPKTAEAATPQRKIEIRQGE